MEDKDPINSLIGEWAVIRPDLDFQPMSLFARCNRFVMLGLRQLELVLGEHDLTIGDFDVLSSLRRSGDTFTLRPSELAERVMVTRAGVTSRVDRLVERGLVKRIRDADDRRSEPIVLTAAGRRKIDGVLEAVVETEASMFSNLDDAQLQRLESLLRQLTSSKGVQK
jgi:DNA-binding MarR family transcriptional regulator